MIFTSMKKYLTHDSPLVQLKASFILKHWFLKDLWRLEGLCNWKEDTGATYDQKRSRKEANLPLWVLWLSAIRLFGVVLSTDHYELKIPAGKSFLFLIFSMKSLVETGIPFKLGKTQGKLEFFHSQRCLVNWRLLEFHIRTLPGWLGWYKQKHDGKRKFWGSS